MALKKQKTNVEGIDCNYWVATVNSDGKTKRSHIVMNGFISEEKREEGFGFVDRIACGTLNIMYPTGEEVYDFVKESKMEQQLLLDEDGNPDLDADGNEQYEDIETNFFIDAEDC